MLGSARSIAAYAAPCRVRLSLHVRLVTLAHGHRERAELTSRRDKLEVMRHRWVVNQSVSNHLVGPFVLSLKRVNRL